MKNFATKLAVLGMVGAMFAIPVASQADALRVNLLGLHVTIGHDHCAPTPVVVVDIYNWQWRRDHGYSDWQWYRDHPGYRGDRGGDRGRHDRR